MYSFVSLIFNANSVLRYYVIEELYFILMKSILLEASMTDNFVELIINPRNSDNMIYFIDVNQKVIQVDNHKNV